MAENNGLTGLEIAVIGMSGRFPGARNIDEFWENLKNGVESVIFYSNEELLEAGVDPVLIENPDYVKSGGGRIADVEYFDAQFFGYPPNEATVINPQTRIFHECAWEALEQAGYDPGSYKGKIGLYAGASSSTAWETLVNLSGKADEVGRFAAVSLADSNFLCTRIAYKLNLKGPVYAVQTACSTSLSAIDMACRGILTGQCNMALAGGVFLKKVREPKGYFFKEGMIASRDGHCRAFDEDAQGTISGEGCGIVLLKLMEEAVADRDTIHAIIKGSASNNDGSRKVGFTAPSIEGQVEVIRAAFLAAEIDPESITYVETHGTGTPLGDPVEIEALKQGFGTNKKGFCFIGSVKTNIGHLDTAAGVAGFIKTVLALKHGQIPPSLNFNIPNPKIDFVNSPFIVNTILREWPAGNYPLRAGVSAFGIGGTNAHVILEGYTNAVAVQESGGTAPQGAFYYLIPISARTECALNNMTANLSNYLRLNRENIELDDVVYTLQVGRKRFRQRKMSVCSSIDEVIDELSSPTTGKTLSFTAPEKSPAIILMFPGQGAYVDMARELYQKEPVFQQEMNRCFEILKPITGYDIKTVLYPSFDDNRNNSNRSYESYRTDINQTEIAQPVIFIIEYALAKLLMSWGITPNAMIGHSTGEYTAACLAGVFSLENALKIVTLRDKPILKPLIDVFKQIPLNKPVIPYVSSITGTWVSGEQATDPTYWVNHLHQTVRFSDGVKELLKIENSIFIEVGPGRELTAFVEEYEPGKSGRQVIRLVRHPHEEIPDVYFLYREIGKLWLYGKEIDWPAFHRGGPGRRIPLPVYPFERQLFRIEKNTRAIPVPAGDLADCFYIPQWKRNIAVYRKKTGLEKNRWLIFMDRVGLGTHLVKYLEAKGDDVITVIAGETIQPQKTGDYLQLFQTLTANGKIADRIVHLWTLTGPVSSAAEKSFTRHFEETQTLGFYSLFHIAKAIRQISPGSNQRFRIYVISDHWQDVTGAEEIDPAKATMAGPLAVIPQEHPNIRCRSIDIIYPGSHAEALAGSLIEEMLNDKSEPLVAFRGPYRLTREFEPLHLGGVKREQLPLKEKGVYLITGGLGKIGSILAGFLARDYQARLILTSRSGNYDNEKIKEWENNGAEVMILKADAGDRVSIQNLIAAALERWGEINGVIHAAGIVKGASFNTVDNLQPGDCREQFQAKVYGTYIIDELLADKNLDFCILISSISVILGGLQFAVYAGANAFMDAFISKVKSRNPHWLSIDWDRMPERETIEAFKRVLALPLTRTGSVAVSSTGSLQARIDRWINLEITEENQETLTNARTDGFDSQKSYYPRPQLFTPYAAPMTKTQEDMVEIWKQLFGFDRVGIHDDFLELGGDSLKAITVLTAVHQKLNTAIPLPIFFSNPTIEKLAEYINSTKNVDKTSYLAIAPVEEKEYYSLSSAQKRLYFLQQLDLKSISYNMPFIYPLPKEINREKLESTLKHLIARHESLRTSFIEVKGEVVQRVHQNVDFAIEYYDLTGAETNVFGSPETFFQKGFGPPEAFIRPFDLSCAPLIRSGIMKFPGDQWFWLLDMHHIISDGTSHTILTEDFAELYDGVILEPLLLQYKDYAQWQNRMLENEKIKAQEDYWANLYTGEIPRLNMPADNKRPAVFTFAGDHFSFILDPGDAAKIKALGSAAGGTLYMSLLATLNILFFKYTGQSDIIIGCGIAGRPHADLQRIVGMFVNTLAMRNYPVGEKIYRLFLKEVIDQSIQAFANQDVQFEELVDRLAVERDPSRNPLFDITMVLQNFRQAKALTAATELVPERKTLYKNPTSKFDMTIFVQERNDDVHIVIEYYTAIFKLSTIQRFATHFTNVIKAVSLEPESSLKDIEILTPGEKSQVLYEFNCSSRDFPKGMTIHGLFEGQVDRAAGAVALNYKDRMISYGALDAQANRLARYLCHEKGIKPEDKVGIWMSPSLERVIAILGVLKAGAGYVPIDPVLPVGRIEYMIKDAVIGLVLSEKKYIRDLERLQWECREFHTYLCLDSFAVHSEIESERNELMDKELWRHVGETAVDDITAGGWLSSYTGEPFSREEMDEYGDNILAKLSSLLHPETRVLEIGCASGISMYRIAHRVGFYYGTDLSASVINRGKKELVQRGIQNITLSCLEAHEIDRIAEKNFDLIIINSVIQCFHGYNYLRRVIEKSINLLSEKGYLFIGDVMDLEKKKVLVQELMEFKRCNRGKGYSTKTDFSAELFVSRGFWKDLQTEFSGIQAVEFSPKIYTIENELTKFRYDVLLKINKKITPKKPAGKVKFQQDLRALKDMEDSPLDLPIKASNPAYIIYTSGTTGKPKGVMIEHTPVVNFIFSMYTDYEKNFGPADHCLGLTNFCFDVSVCEIFMPLVFGASIVLPAYKKFFDPGLVADVIIKKSITFTYLPPGLLQEIVDCLAVRLQGLTAGLELNKLLVGVEPIKDEILEAYLRLNPGMKIINGYGPTETTICASAYRYEPGNPEGKRVPIGRPLANMSIVLLDKCDHFVPVGVPGELCIAGTGLARGYLNRPEFTAEKFKRAVIKNLSKPTDDPCPMTNDRFYKTGDLARWLPDGNIMFIGRIDHQVKVRGFRIELGEIESLLQKHEAVRAAVVTVNNEDAYLCAYIITADKEILDSQLKEYLEESLPDYMIPSYFIQLEKLPLTPNGKIDRKALPVPGYKVDESYTAPTNEIEKKLTLIWSEILGIKEDAISIDAGFFNMGGHSLKATILASRVHKELNVLLPLAEVFKTPTVRGLAAYIKSVARQEYASIEPVEKKEYYPLSSAQKRLYILQQFDPGSVSYNMPQVIPLAGGIDLQKLESIFQVLIARHESLRTSFEMVNNEPVQIIHDKVEFEINKSFARLFQKRPLDLSCAPLLRVGFTGERLWVDIHHIITDGVSQSVLREEFEALYKGQDLAPLKLQYKDYSHWQNSREHQVIIKQQESYWLREFSGELPVLDLPVDFARPPVQSFSGGTVGFVIESAGTQALKKIMAEAGVSLFMVILAVFNVLLSRLSGQEDIVVGTPVAGRRHADLERIIGMFVNTLALRNYPAGEKPFLVFLAELKERTLAVFENQEYPFEDLVDKLSLARDTGRNPIFDVVFNLLNQQEHNSVIENIGNLNKHKRSAAKFDMTLTGGELGERLFFSIEYCTRLFEPGTIDRMIAYFKHIVEALALEPNLRIGEIEIITQQEREQILHEFNDTVTVCSIDKTIQQLFAEQVERNSDHMALVGADLRVCPNCLTYRELHEQSSRLAGLLIEKGVQAGSIVAIKIERSLEMIIGILGILKSGGAYLPIAPDYPQERIDYMLNDSGSKMVVNSELIKNVSFHHSSFLIPHSNSANNLAYIIYTSGSTGKPKGVPIRHDNLSPLLHWGYKQLGIGTKDRFLQNVAYYFDWSVWEIVMALSSGASLYQAADEMMLNPGKCISFMKKNGITVLHATPGQYGYFIDVGVKLQTLKYLFLGAEKLTFDLLTRALDSVNEDCRVFNMYGPTECTIISAVYEIERLGVNALASRGLGSVPIGVAVGNTGLMILDNYKKLCPVNVRGELYIAGNGVAWGYLNNPELTNQKFLKTQMSESFFKTVPGFYYKTGDLARRLSDGNIEFLGRIDQQVKIRGFRIELGEIENRLTKYPGIKQAIVLDLAGEQDKYLCAYVISDKEYGLTELRGFLAEALPDYMIPSYFVAIKKVPLSANGKINRRALPKPGLNLVDRYIAPTNEIEKKLVVLWAELLGISSSRISIDDNFFHLGGHSLKATQLTARIHRLFNVEISLVELFKNPTVRGTASVISKAEVMLFMDIKKAEKKDFYELSFNQKRLWFIQQMNPAGSSFNMPGRWVFNHPVEDEWIEETLSQMMLRHESLRTGFKVIADQPVQYIMNEALLPLKRMDISMLSREDKKRKQEEIFRETAGMPFDLTKAPLFRTVLLKLDSRMYEFMFTMHHIITDGWSMEIIKKDFNLIYEGHRTGKTVAIKSSNFQYTDFVEWHNNRLQEPSHKQDSHSYWKRKMENGIQSLTLPGDFAGGRESREGAGYYCIIEKNITERIRGLAEQENTTLFTVLFSVYLILLSRLSGEEEVPCSIISAGREHISLHSIVGFFVNSIVYSTPVDLKMSFANFVRKIKEDTLELFRHQDYPLELIFEELGTRYPEIPVTFNMLSMLATDELTLIQNAHTSNPVEVKFDLEPYITEYKNGLQVYWSYKKNLFRPETIAYIADEYIRMIDFFSRNSETSYLDYRKSTITNKSVSERKLSPLEPGFETIANAFENQVEKTPYRIAVKIKNNHFTYDELNRYAGRIAGLIGNKLKLKQGERVGLLFEHGYDMIAAIIGALKAGQVYVPLSSSYPLKRLSYMLADSESSLLLTNNENMSLAPALVEENHIEIGNIDESNHDILIEKPGISSDSPAYILYTSGSTGNPKGVVQNHENVLYYTRNWGRVFAISCEDKMTLFSSFCHDGSVQDMFGALLTGATLYPYDMKAREESTPDLSDFLNKEKITIWHSVPSLFGYFLHSLDDRKMFSHLRFILLGGEPLRAHEVALAGEFFPRTTLANIYGQTESSVSSIWSIKPGDRETFSKVIIGEPLDNTDILLMDEEQNVVGPLEMGEIIVACPHLALGYRRNEEAGRKVFSIHPTYGKIYRTGDMGRLLIDGNIEFIGRKDSQVKIRGFRIELGEIESRLLKYEVIKEAIVNVVEIAGDKYLCAYIVCNNQVPGVENEELSTRLKVYLAEFLPDYMIPTHFICMERLPLTPGGKINRKALPMPEIGEINRNTHVAPRTFVEIKLHDIWHDVLKTPGEIGVTDDFFRLGGHSLRAAALASRIQKAFNVKVPLMEIFKRPTIGGLAQYINIAKKEKYAAIEPVEKREYYALSPAQKRLYILQQMEIESVHYNMPQVIPFSGKIDIERMEWVFKELIQRHEILRTSFVMVAEEPVQRIQAKVAFEIKVFAELFSKSDPPGPLPGRGSLLKFIRPFDLSQGPLLRAGIINYADGNSILLVDMHHIITDGTSNRILKEEFKTLYFGKGELPQLRLQYKDYSQWQNSKMHQELIKQQETYWLKSFEGELPVLHLPIDFIRPPVQTFEGCTVDFFIEAAEIIDLKKLTAEVKASLFMVILAAFNVLLFKLTGQEDIVIGTPAAARRHTDLEGIIGMFVNILALRNYPIAEKPFLVFFKELKSRTLAVFENQEYPFEDLVDKLAVPRDTGRNPIFDIVFNLLNQKDYNSEDPGNIDIIRDINGHKKGVAKFDMTLTAVEFREGVFFTFEYCTRLFKPGTIDRMIGYFKHILEQLALAPNLPIGEIDIISEYERRQILNEFNGSETVYLIDKTIGQLFAEQVQTSPDRIAVVGPTMSNHRAAVRLQITYRRLDEQSGQLAALLSEKGVQADSIVGIMMERSLEMITGILGILKSGGAYLPVATDFPQERIDYMLKDSGAKLLVTGKNKEDENGRWCGGEKVLLEEISRSPKNSSYLLTSLPSCLQNSSSLAYIIYTSGSTGKPKGVMVQHDNVIRVVKNTNYIELDSFDRILQLSGYAFDGSVFDIFGALLNGASLVLISREDVLAVNRLSETIEKEAITVFFVTTALFNTLVDLKIACLSRIRSVLVGGERISTAYSRKALDYLGKGRIVNVYGPTETTVYATYYRIDAIAASSVSIPIGKPVSHTTIYILDKNVKPVPVGVFGEIYIGGTGVARGYLNNPELTAGRFKRNVDRYLSVVIRNSSNLTNDRCLMTNDCFYKTGDLARWLPEGNIEFLGRIDHQVKIRGFRVELGEIENRLANYPGIKEAVVLVHEEGQNDKYICAYFISERECNVSELHEFLAKELPDYMIPTYFRQLEQIPLTANGKIDRKALPEPGLKAGRDYVAPGNNVETKLVNLWAEVLNLEPGLISIDANFFQLGGHSLKATILLAKIQKEFKVNIPLGILFNAPNIRLLAENISREEKTIAIDDAGMVLLKKGRNPENNLFFIHDGSGEVEGYLEFCSCLGSDFSFNCRGIRAERLDNYAPKDISIEEMAGSYIKKIKTLQPSGPFHIVGWSMGGTIAFEITRQLEELNEKVDFLAMIDAVPPFNENTMKVFNPDTERDLIKNLAGGNMFVKELQEITGIENIWAAFVRFLETDNDEAQKIKALAAKSKDLIIPNLDFLNIGEVIRFFNLMRSFVKARAFYMPSSKIDAPVHYFRSSRSQVKNVELWNNFSHNRIKMYDVDGDHYSIFKLPRVIDFAVIFNAAFLKNMK